MAADACVELFHCGRQKVERFGSLPTMKVLISGNTSATDVNHAANASGVPTPFASGNGYTANATATPASFACVMAAARSDCVGIAVGFDGSQRTVVTFCFRPMPAIAL